MDIAGSDNFPAVVRVIDDGDLCSNAEHGATAQDLADRTKWAELRIKPFWEGGTVQPTGSVVVDLSFARWTFQGNDDFNLYLGTGVQLFADGRMAGHMFTPGRSGRANRKPQVITPGAGVTDIDPSIYDTIFATPSAGCSLRIAPSLAVEDGDWIEVVNHSSANGALVLTPASGTPTGDTSPLKRADASYFSGIYVYAGGSWRMASASYFKL